MSPELSALSHDVSLGLDAAELLEATPQALASPSLPPHHTVCHDLIEALGSVFSHDLADPLRIARSQLPHTPTGAIAPIEETLHRLMQLRELMWLAHQPLKVERLALDTLWHQVQQEAEAAIHERGLTLRADPLPDISGDAGLLVYLLRAMLRYSLQSNTAIAPALHLVAMRQKHGWEIRFRDNGTAIDPDYHELVFGLFARLHDTPAAAPSGL